MQIYEEKSAEFIDFVREMRGFGEYRTKKEEKNRHKKAQPDGCAGIMITVGGVSYYSV